MPETEIDTSNDFCVGVIGDELAILNRAKTRGRFSKAEALRLAAWLVVLADDDDQFPAVLEAVRNT